MTKTESNIVLLSITICWASSYVFMKNLPDSFSSFAYLALTSTIASIIFAIVFFKKLKGFNRKLLLQSFVTAIILSITLLLEKIGVSEMPASQASFIASLSIVIVPVLLLFFKKRPTKNNLLGIVIILMGLALTSGVKVGEPLHSGILPMLAACVSTSIYTILIDRYTKSSDPLLLGIGQMFFSAIIGWGLWLIESPNIFESLVVTKMLIANVFLLAFFAKAYAYIMLMYSQKYANPISVTVIAATEPIITLVLASLIPSTFGVTEQFTTSKISGALLIAIGAICAGTNFLQGKEVKLVEEPH